MRRGVCTSDATLLPGIRYKNHWDSAQEKHGYPQVIHGIALKSAWDCIQAVSTENRLSRLMLEKCQRD